VFEFKFEQKIEIFENWTTLFFIFVIQWWVILFLLLSFSCAMEFGDSWLHQGMKIWVA